MKKDYKNEVFILIGMILTFFGVFSLINTKIPTNFWELLVILPFILLLLYGILLFIRGIRNIRLEKKGIILPGQENSALKKTSKVVGISFLLIILFVFVPMILILLFIMSAWKG
ncbi:hypothetical protein CO033_02355 [Candidatus Nomurabacteria bacterium CG_4_9_14_0_2_um_filter_32_10]|uniref:Uncharacterized protein n=3 Tax=Candidatus Nomuraibacteriota TaxID=1752729 RepID=A0A2H0CG86_9BACT|nr:MAG: hypothetical protein COW91_02975 [Candidatus Nomurabacteria bacterium CG22_combo_CG10-13_8_21_14_all_32_8]PIZ85249.1 MAG: hypothetical protein COX94_03030 [Candidatus Nomurabacteria bacterium CG_4_10_14_0_2_um_filter_33_9]PJC49305.1 MAG: hypothetical protein CO033_02355 [Candidatus Nomurabacteria bacterium CG_4_9_14_0_2_um_filter_32_10]